MRLLFLSLLLVGLMPQLQAQYFDKTYSLALDVNVPLSNTDYVDNISARGFKFGYREMITEKLFGGIDFTNSTYTKHVPRTTYNNGNRAITTDLFNYTYDYGLTLSFDYFLKTEQHLMPYVGLGVGASYLSYKQFFNVYTSEANSWGVLVRPQAGVLWRPRDDSSWAIQGAIHYDYSSAKSEELELGAFHNLGLQIGVIFLNW
ncbi:MAG: hypothetical protein RIA63_07285 [Cyclobacteriaceae bacterium]